MHLKAIASSGQNKKGMTLLEVIIALGILAIVIVSFLGFFTNANIGLISSGRRIDATLEAKSLLDRINTSLRDSNSITLAAIRDSIEGIINKDECLITSSEEEFYRYDKKIHLLISETDISLESYNGEEAHRKVCEIRILNFYDNGKKNVEFTIYIPMGEDKNE